VFTTDRVAIKEILIIKNYPKTQYLMSRVMFPFNERYLGFGLVTEPGNESWQRRRSFFNPGFHRKYLLIILSRLRL
jgi:cytochrome P450